MRFNPFSTKNYQGESDSSSGFEQDSSTKKEQQQAPKSIMVDAQEIEDMKNMIMLAGRMRMLLQKVRYESLPLNIAKEIDYVLRDATNFD